MFAVLEELTGCSIVGFALSKEFRLENKGFAGALLNGVDAADVVFCPLSLPNSPEVLEVVAVVDAEFEIGAEVVEGNREVCALNGFCDPSPGKMEESPLLLWLC